MFITFEGPDGGGKSSQVQKLADYLKSIGQKVLTTYEPGGTHISDQIRDVLKRMDNKGMNPRTEILLFCAARAQLIDEVIKPHLDKGYIVISDRYADSTMAYQGYGHQMDLGFLRVLLDFATLSLKPDLTILFDVDTKTGLSRKRTQNNWDRLDDYEIAFHQRVKKGYYELAALEPERWQILDANQDEEQVFSSLKALIKEKVKN